MKKPIKKEVISEVIIAVMSDLHCHHSRKYMKTDKAVIESYLTTDKPRLPAKNHPIESLIKIIKENKITSDFLVCPGDITHQVDIQGFISGWSFVKEIGGALNVEKTDIFATLGNHDVDSRYNHNQEVFDLAQSIGNDYPFNDEATKDMFWAKGFCFVERDNLRILIINSVHFHTHKDQSVHGKINKRQLEQIENLLEKTTDDKIQVALFHHHPIEHSRFDLGTEDTIKKGQQLVDLLNKFSFDLIIHGHKHDPWLRYANGKSTSVPIFSSGSFSVASKSMITGSKNTFHIIKLKKNNTSRACGVIDTWEFLPNNGWRVADSGKEYFPMTTGFGFLGNMDELVKKTIEFIKNGNGEFVAWDLLIDTVKDINYLTPDEAILFQEKLSIENIITSPELPRKPKLIGKTHVG